MVHSVDAVADAVTDIAVRIWADSMTDAVSDTFTDLLGDAAPKSMADVDSVANSGADYY